MEWGKKYSCGLFYRLPAGNVRINKKKMESYICRIHYFSTLRRAAREASPCKLISLGYILMIFIYWSVIV